MYSLSNPISGRAWVFGHHVDTDVIIPARYLTSHMPSELGKHCMEDAMRDFSSLVSPGDIIVAGENFGCGSSREHAPLAILGCGVACVVASSFARIFYRNAINVGLPIVELPQSTSMASQGDLLEIHLGEGRIKNLSTGAVREFIPIEGVAKEIISAGGLVNYVRHILATHPGAWTESTNG